MNSRRSGVGVLLTLSLAMACSPERPVSPEEPSEPAFAVNPIASNQSNPIGLQALLLGLSKAEPAFGGLYVSPDDRSVVVYSVESSADSRILQRVREYVREDPGRFGSLDGQIPPVRVMRGQYSFAQLLRLQAEIVSLRAADDGLGGVDADEMRNRVRLIVWDESKMDAFSKKLATRLISVEAVVFDVIGGPIMTAASLQDKIRPQLGAGIQTQNHLTCSMGFMLADSTGAKQFLTAAHCGSSFAGSTGQTAYQNTATFGNRVGVQTAAPSWNTTGCAPGVSYCSLADVAVVTIDSSSHYARRVAESSSVGSGSGIGNLTIGSWYSVGTQGDVVSGTEVYRTGRSSGSTKGNVLGTCVNLYPIYDGATGLYVQVTCASEVGARATGGDSGGPVYHFRFPLASNARQADGILFAATNASPYRYYYNSISEMETWLARPLRLYMP